jgi:hypothetical protein
VGDDVPGVAREKKDRSKEFWNFEGGSAVLVGENQATIIWVRVFQNAGQDWFDEHVLPVNVGGKGFALLVSANDDVKASIRGLHEIFAKLESAFPN